MFINWKILGPKFLETQRTQIPSGCNYEGKCLLTFGSKPTWYVLFVTPRGSGLQKKAANELNFLVSGKKWKLSRNTGCFRGSIEVGRWGFHLWTWSLEWTNKEQFRPSSIASLHTKCWTCLREEPGAYASKVTGRRSSKRTQALLFFPESHLPSITFLWRCQQLSHAGWNLWGGLHTYSETKTK